MEFIRLAVQIVQKSTAVWWCECNALLTRAWQQEMAMAMITIIVCMQMNVQFNYVIIFFNNIEFIQPQIQMGIVPLN